MRLERMKVKTRRVLCYLLISVVSLLLACQVGQAQYAPAGMFGLSPTMYNIELRDGTGRLLEFCLSNSTAKPMTFSIYVTGLTLDRGGGRDFPDLDSAGEFSIAKWIRLLDVKSENVVYSHDMLKFSAEVSVPKGTKPGDYYGVIMIEPTEFDSVRAFGPEIKIKSRIGAVLKVTVPGPISALNLRCSVSEMVVDLPDEERLGLFRRIAESASEVVSDENIDDVAKVMTLFDSVFDETVYKSWELDKQTAFMTQLKDFLNERILEEEEIKIRATLATQARTTIIAKGEVSVYQKVDTGKGRYLRQLRDKFILVPAGEEVRGEGTVFPGGMRDFDGVVERPLPPGEYIAETLFRFRGEGEEQTRLVSGSTEFVVSKAVAARQKDLLVLDVNPELLEYSMVPGESHIEALEIENMDPVRELEVEIFASDPSWIEIPTPTVTIGPGRSKKVRIVVKIPRDAKEVERIGKIGIAATQGKPVYVDIRVKDKRPVKVGK